jgi:S-adenosylmethionine decarboxylase
MLLKDFDLDNYLFGINKKELVKTEKKIIKQKLKREMFEIFYGRNMS